MQKAREIRDLKWAAEDAFLNALGVKYGRTHLETCSKIGEVNVTNRDRPGGHQTQYMKGWYGWKKSKSNKRISSKQLRQQHRKAKAKALADYEWCNEFYLYPYGTDLIEYNSLQEQFEEEERERNYQRDELFACQNATEDDFFWGDDSVYEDILNDHYNEVYW